jgi:hypothetical protein
VSSSMHSVLAHSASSGGLLRDRECVVTYQRDVDDEQLDIARRL